MTLEEMKALDPESQETLFKKVSKARSQAKVVTYSAVYGIGAAKLAREMGTSQREAQVLLDSYWVKNWAVKDIAKNAYVKTLKDGTIWLKNPVSGFYYNLRYDKDRWSTLNQSTGVFAFDSWVMRCRKKGVVFSLQYHDEHLSYVPKGQEGKHTELLEEAMREVNETLKLNVEITSDIQYGPSYSAVH